MTRPFHSDRMVGKFRADAERYADCSIALEGQTTTRNPNGTPNVPWFAIAVYAGRCRKASTADVERFASRGEQATQVWRIVLPAGVAVTLEHRVTVTIPTRGDVLGAQFVAYIIGTTSPKSSEAEVTVFGEERDAA